MIPNTLTCGLLSALLMALPPAPPPSSLPGDEPALFLLRRGPDGPRIEALALADGDRQSLESSRESGLVTVILPPARGGSGSLEQLVAPRTFEVWRTGDEVGCTVHLPGGQSVAMPSRRLSELRGDDVRLSVSGAAGPEGSFVIRRWSRIEPDDVGPVIDLFGGRVPVQPGDAVLFTRTWQARGPGVLDGDAPLVDAGGYLFVPVRGPDGREHEFVLDFGAGTTIVARDVLPENAEILDLGMLEHSEGGTRRLQYTLGGATGDVAGFLGAVRLEELACGELRFTDVEASVMEVLPELAGRSIAGILGVDLLSRADLVDFGYDGEDGTLRLRSGTAAAPDGTAALELPLSLVGRTIYLRGVLGETDVHFLMDTGSSHNLLADGPATAALSDVGPGRTLRGLGGQPLDVRRGTAGRLHLGDEELAGVVFEFGELPVFGPVARGQHAGLLGNALFRRFDRVQVDFARSRLRLMR
jgi:hypothetical protein